MNHCSLILQMRLREIQDISQGSTDYKGQSQDLNPGTLAPGQCSFCCFCKLHGWAPWQSGLVGGKRERDWLVVMRMNQQGLTKRIKRWWSQKREGGLDWENRGKGSRVCHFPGRFPRYEEREGFIGKRGGSGQALIGILLRKSGLPIPCEFLL